MESNTEDIKNRPHKPGPPKRRPSEPEVPPASETWVEGQPTSDADYPDPDKTEEPR